MNPPNLFFSYSHKDEDLRDKLESHLSILKRQSIISSWHDRRITAGKEWSGLIDNHLNSAQIVLLLISADFLASDYCYDIELRRALERHENGETRVIPIILRPVDWRGAPFSKLQALPKDAKPVTQWNDIDEAFMNITQGIRIVAEELTGLNKSAGMPISEDLDLDRPITIKRIRKQERINAEIIANVAFSSVGDLMAYSLDNRLFILPLNDVFPERLGMHEHKGSISSTSDNDSGNIDLQQDLYAQEELKGENRNEAHLVRITDISFSPNGELVASADNDGHVKFWSLRTRECIAELSEHFDAVTSLSFSPQGNLFASASYDEFIYVWETDSILSHESKSIMTFEKKSKIKKRPRYKHDIEQITSMTFSQSGKHLASGDQQGIVVVREVASGDEVYRNKVHNDVVTSIAFSPTQKGLLATSSGDTRIRLTDCLSGASPVTLGTGPDKHSDWVVSIAFSYKGDILVSSGCDKRVKLWDVARKKLLYTYLTEDDRTVEKVAFFPNQYDFATDSYYSNISLWDILNEGSIVNTRIEFHY